MAIYNSYASLKTGIARWLNREDDANIDTVAAELIELAEAKIRRNQQWFQQVFSLTNAGNPLTITAYPQELPVNVKEITYLWASTSTYKHNITVLPISAWRDLVATDRGAAGVPTKAVFVPQMDRWMRDDANRDGPMLYLWPAPTTDGTFAVDFDYIRDVEPLATDDVLGNNGLFLRHPDLYLFGALTESAPFYEHDERMPMWEVKYEKIVKEINLEAERAKFGSAVKRTRLPRVF